MPDRIVRASILTSDPVARLSWGAEVFYRRLFSVADDYGRYDGRPSILRAALYPLQIDRVTEPNVLKWLDECSTAGVVRVYLVSDRQYLEVVKFNQRINGRPKFPDPPTITETGETPVEPGAAGDSRPRAPSPSPSPSSKVGGSAEGVWISSLPFQSEEFKAAWLDWLKHRKEIKKPVTPTQAEAQLAKLGAMKEADAISMVRNTIEKGWQGLREPEVAQGGYKLTPARPLEKNIGWRPDPLVTEVPAPEALGKEIAAQLAEFRKQAK